MVYSKKPGGIQKMIEKIFALGKKISNLYLLTTLTLAAFIVYSNTLPNKLFFDDEDFIYKNEYITSFKFLPQYFSQNLIAGAGKISNYYRPVLLITYAAEYKLFGLAPFIYHLDNLLIHIGCGISLFLLLYKLFKSKFLAFSTSFLFAIHPVNTEAVSYAAGRGDPLFFFFLLLFLYLSLFKSRKHYFFSFFFFVLSLLSKETALIGPFLFLLVHFIYQKDYKEKVILKIIKKSIPFFIIDFIYFFLRLTVLNFQNTLNFYNYQNAYTNSIFIRLNTFLNLIPAYLYLLINPVNLHMERQVNIFNQITPNEVITFALLIFLFIFSLRTFRKTPVLLFAFLWFFINFIPSSGIIPISGVFYEHFLYSPAVGFYLFLSFLLLKFINKLKNSYLKLCLLTLFLIYLIILGIKTVKRNSEWYDAITFYNNMFRYTESSRARNNLAMAYAQDGNNQKAIEQYKKALTLSDVYPETHYNLANSYSALGDLDSAGKEYKKAIGLDKYFYLAYIKLYLLYRAKADQKNLTEFLHNLQNLAQNDKNFDKLLLALKSLK